MKIRFTLSLLFLLVLTTALQARQRTIAEAKNIAVSHYNSLQQLRSAQDVDFELVYSGPSSGLRSSSDPYYYVFNASGAKGYVMVSGDDRILPVLGYSTDGAFDPANIPANMQGWFEGYEKQIDYVLSQPGITLPAATDNLHSRDAFPDHIDPMITTEWSQDAPYNDLCPMDGNARSVTGCVATSMSQLMYYHKWPEKGQGQITYHASTLDRDISVNFEDYTFDWANMTAVYDSTSTAVQNLAVAQLMYAAGTACQMDYSSAASNAYSIIAADALKTYFGYDKNVYDKQRSYYSSSEWIKLIKTELTAKRPVMYNGTAYIGGHSFICDGYDKDGLFHINWGWGGWYDGYFQLDILNPYLSENLGLGGFSYQQDVVIGIQKPTSSGTKPEGALLQYSMILSADKYAQGDSLFATGKFMYEGNEPAEIEVGLALYKDNELYELLSNSQGVFDPASIYYIGFVDTIAPFTLPAGEYYLKYVCRPYGEDEWKNVIHSYTSNSYKNYLLKASQDSIHVLSISTELACTELTADKELHQNTTNIFRTKIKNLQTLEVNPRISIIYEPNNKEGELKIVSTEGIYLSAGEEKELLMPVFPDMEPGVYDFWVCYLENDNYYYYINEKPVTLEVFPEEDETASQQLNLPVDLKVSVSSKTLSVRSDSPVEDLCIFNLAGKTLRRISPAATDVTLSIGWASDGVYIVAVKNATGWHRYKMIF